MLETSIDLRRPSDLNLVYRSVLNGWDVPQPIRDQIGAQLGDAIAHRTQRMRETQSPREMSRMIKLAKLMLAMDARNQIDDGVPQKCFPFIRKRSPDKRQCRRSRRGNPQALEAELSALLAQLKGNG
jgi:hypothetical protein